jgi:acyl carrier protein
MNAPLEPLTEPPVSEVVARLIAAHLHQPIEDVKPEARLVDDLSADELDLLEIVVALEGEFCIAIDNDEEHEAFARSTVQGCVDLVNRKLIAAAAPKRHGVPA